MNARIIALTASALVLLAGCNQEKTAKGEEPVVSINQAELCQVSDLVSVLGGDLPCKPGQKVMFLPNRYGNEQLPILFAAKVCDLRYSVVSNPGGVVCIYQPPTPPKRESNENSKRETK